MALSVLRSTLSSSVLAAFSSSSWVRSEMYLVHVAKLYILA
jgi:hypothetical protein